MTVMRSTKTYVLYEDFDGNPKNHWQYWNEPTVPGCTISRIGDCYAPLPRWLVVAHSAKQACHFARNSETTTSRGDSLGVFWERGIHDPPMPIGADLTIWYALEARCGGAPTMTLWRTREEAQDAKERLDPWRCGGRCVGDHVITPMTVGEAEKCASRWAWWKFGDEDVW